jgi:catechol 2,3-dioxygenase-like lactoylglutathione lyase family enzyme
MSRVQLALRVADLEAAVDFYQRLFDTQPAKRRPGYANFAIDQPPLKLVLLESRPGQATVMDHLGVEVQTTDQVTAATRRLADQGLATRTEDQVTCCYAVQDKVWVSDPGGARWEVYTVLGDAPAPAQVPDGVEAEPVSTATAAGDGGNQAGACCEPGCCGS